MGKTVLTVDDSKTLRLIVSKHLTPFGVRMLEAENGEQGVARAREVPPDLILLDYNMPVMDGYHTLAELKTDPALKAIPVIMLTTETVKETVVKLMKLGLKDYIAKPFTRDLLLQKINPILGLYGGTKIPPESAVAGAMRQAATEPEKPLILAIDDKENILKLLKEYIGEQFHVILADCGKAALEAIVRARFDYVFLDLSMPDMSGFDVYNAYIKSPKNSPNPRKVVAMTLRTAQADIERAQTLGIQMILYKPFTPDDVGRVIGCLTAQQKETSSGNAHYLAASGNVRILDCPSDKSPMLRSFAQALGSTVLKEIDGMAEEGLTKLVIKVGEGFLSDWAVTRKFIALVEHAGQLCLSVRLVAESQHARDALKQFAETASIPTDASMECALGSFK